MYLCQYDKKGKSFIIMKNKNIASVRPFVKWAGGKTQLHCCPVKLFALYK